MFSWLRKIYNRLKASNTYSKLLFTVSIALVFSIAAIAIPFILQFSNSKLSGSPEQWGQTGDYFGGLLNPLISLINLIVTLFIAFEVYKLNLEQGKQQVSSQKAILRVQLQYDILKQFEQEVNMRIGQIEQTLNNHPIEYERFNRQHGDLQSTLGDFANTTTIWTERAGNLWMVFRQLVTEWKKPGKASDSTHISRIRTLKTRLFSELYKEILSD